MIIELLYSKFKSKTFWRIVFLYFIEFVIIHQMIWLTEVIHEKKADHYGNEEDSMTDFAKLILEKYFKMNKSLLEYRTFALVSEEIFGIL